MQPEDGRRLIALKDAAVKGFTGENWLELGAITGRLDQVRQHERLLRSLSWGDPDYSTHAFTVLLAMADADEGNLPLIERYVSERFEVEAEANISSSSVPGPRVYFVPSVFSIPDTPPEADLVSVMMPFGAAFATVHAAVVASAKENRMRCLRADDIWVHSTVIQDVFSLIYRSHIVVCDFTGKNPNVMYEAGIAHTLGKHVIPITQQPDDIPFDLQSHRYLRYLGNGEGLAKLTSDLSGRISTLKAMR